MPTWMVRADRNGAAFEAFREAGAVGIGWAELGDLSNLKTRDAVQARYEAALPGRSAQETGMGVGQVDRFLNTFAEGDRVVTYDPSGRVYLCGTVAGPYVYDPTADVRVLSNRRSVRWEHEMSRDELSPSAKTSLGSISTIFAIRPEVAAELWREDESEARNSPPGIEGIAVVVGDGEVEESEQAPDLELLANEAIKDRLAALSWDEMQDLVAGLLRAMGFKTRVSPKGSDRGKDVLASPDGFGFREPRIFVEVKHRTGQSIGSQDLRSFLGGRRPGDKGLYVSTGGCTKEARYEAERANVPTTLMDLEDLVHAIQDHYDAFDTEAKQLLPLKPIFAPTG